MNCARVAVVAGLVALSCSNAGPDVATVEQAILYGTDSPAADDAVVMIGRLRPDGLSAPSCTGTRISPRLVVTARHCTSAIAAGSGDTCGEKGVAPAGSDRFASDYDPTTLFVFTGTKAPIVKPGETKDTLKAIPHATKILHDGAKSVCWHDLAVLVLDRVIEGAPIAPVRLDTQAREHEILTVVGWGRIAGKGDPPAADDYPFPSTRQKRSGVEVLALGPKVAKGDDPAIDAHKFRTKPVICNADSGGAALAEAGSALVGIASANVGTQAMQGKGCAVKLATEYVSLAAHKDVLLRASDEVGEPLTIEGREAPDAGDDAGTTEPLVDSGADASDKPGASLPVGCAIESGSGSAPSTLWLACVLLWQARMRKRHRV